MIYALDSNTISFLLRPSRNPEVVSHLREILEQGDAYVIPALCYYEVYCYLTSKKAARQISNLKKLYAGSAIRIGMKKIEFVKAVEIRANLEGRGLDIKDTDIFIASHCISNDYTLVTDNTSDFEHIEGLKFVNWKN